MQKLEGFKTKSLGFPSRAKRMIVHDEKTLTVARDFVQEVKALMKEISTSYDPIISHAKAEKKKYIDPLKESEKTAKLHITSYLEKQEQIRIEAEEKAKQEEKDRQKKEDEMLEEAKILEDSGKLEEAEAIVEDIPLPPKPEDKPSCAEPLGLVLKKIVDVEAISDYVERTKGKMPIPGVEIYPVWKWKIVKRDLIPEKFYKSSVSTVSKPEDA